MNVDSIIATVEALNNLKGYYNVAIALPRENNKPQFIWKELLKHEAYLWCRDSYGQDFYITEDFGVIGRFNSKPYRRWGVLPSRTILDFYFMDADDAVMFSLRFSEMVA